MKIGLYQKMLLMSKILIRKKLNAVLLILLIRGFFIGALSASLKSEHVQEAT